MTDNALFHATLMPDADWWHTLWPTPENVLKKVGIKKNMQVVDLCCGDGHFSKPMCQLVSPGKIWAVDLDRELLEQAKLGCSNNNNFTAIHGDARELAKHIKEAVDFIFIANTFHGVPEKTELAKVAYKVLKPEGHFAIINWHKRPREETRVLDLPRGPDTELRMSAEEVQNYVEPAGFKLETITDVGPYHYAVIFVKV